MNHYYKDNLHLVEKGNGKLAKAGTAVFNMGAIKQQQNLRQISQKHQQERPQHQQKHCYQQQEGQQHWEEFQKHQKNDQSKKQNPNNIKQNVNCLKKNSRNIRKENSDINNKQYKNKQLKQHHQQQQQQKQRNQQQQRDETQNDHENGTNMSRSKKTYSKIFAAKPYEDVKSSYTKYVYELRDKTVVNFVYNFLFLGQFCFVSFIVNFTFFALESSGKLATICSSIILTALSGSRVKLILKLLIIEAYQALIIGTFFLYRMNQ